MEEAIKESVVRGSESMQLMNVLRMVMVNGSTACQLFIVFLAHF